MDRLMKNNGRNGCQLKKDRSCSKRRRIRMRTF